MLQPVAQSMGIEIYAPTNGFISFFNSPYYSHRNALAVDIYPNVDWQHPHAPSPVEGTITDIYEFKSPHQRYFKTPQTEKLILISNPRKPELRVRILHVDCRLEVGTRVAVGDPLGNLERSGFFNFWTAGHMHLEVRKKEEPLRAKGAFPMEPINLGKGADGEPQDKIPAMRIEDTGDDYILAETGGIVRLGSFWGLGCTVNGQRGILDCGLPHYGYGGVHFTEPSSIKGGDPVRLWGRNIGLVTWVCGNFALFKCRPLEVYVDDVRFRGFSLYLWLRENKRVKIVPREPGVCSTITKLSRIKLRPD